MKVRVGRGVRVGEEVHVGRGVLVGVRVHTMGVRVNVGVADNAAMNARIRSVLTAKVARAIWSLLRVAEGKGVNVGAGPLVWDGICDAVGAATAVEVAESGNG